MISFLVVPIAVNALAINSAHVSMSFFVYPTTVGFPVVPEEACILITFSRGTVNRPYG